MSGFDKLSKGTQTVLTVMGILFPVLLIAAKSLPGDVTMILSISYVVVGSLAALFTHLYSRRNSD